MMTIEEMLLKMKRGRRMSYPGERGKLVFAVMRLHTKKEARYLVFDGEQHSRDYSAAEAAAMIEKVMSK